jgi:hypothetical protein
VRPWLAVAAAVCCILVLYRHAACWAWKGSSRTRQQHCNGEAFSSGSVTLLRQQQH